MHPTDGDISQEVFNLIQASGQPFPHTGRDYKAKRGATVRTIAPGTVIYAGRGEHVPGNLVNLYQLVPGSTAAGNCVFIQHDGWVEYFAHLDSIDVKAGQVVHRGQRVGGAGDSGNTQGIHLHYEVFVAPCPAEFPWGRYHPQNQINLEDSLANGTEPVDMPLSNADINLMQAMHTVTREWLDGQITKAIKEVERSTQNQQDVTRKFINDTLTRNTQAQQDVTRKYLADKVAEN